MLVIYQVFATSEGIKRNISAAGDAQQNGLRRRSCWASRLRMPATGWPVAAQDPRQLHRRRRNEGFAAADSLADYPGANDNTPDSSSSLQRRAHAAVAVRVDPDGA